ncbi:helix-turn-helix domain-containing protein [Paenibacillus campinasensis]|uniref:Transcriptional regulator n=1 Tax=Paenibacillus campinasensis TaxID=66347 RepID=A0A268EH10_9BACL|nr:helix-turn-helix domain-containing protein [Paenibacillus campinasensis]PAD72402.1 transcriptional regulator [Paenibacillus campinasensis]
MLRPSFKPLKRTLLDRDITASELREATGIAPSTYTKMNNGEFVALQVIARICEYLDCRIEDVVEFVEDPAS